MPSCWDKFEDLIMEEDSYMVYFGISNNSNDTCHYSLFVHKPNNNSQCFEYIMGNSICPLDSVRGGLLYSGNNSNLECNSWQSYLKYKNADTLYVILSSKTFFVSRDNSCDEIKLDSTVLRVFKCFDSNLPASGNISFAYP